MKFITFSLFKIRKWKIDLFINIYQEIYSSWTSIDSSYLHKNMENDMRKALLNKKSGAFDKQF